jgi:hypothetical protein
MTRYDVLIFTATSALTTIAYSERSDSSKFFIEVQGDTKIHMFELSWDKASSVSRFFKKAFQGNFLEATAGTMSIIDLSAELFGDSEMDDL